MNIYIYMCDSIIIFCALSQIVNNSDLAVFVENFLLKRYVAVLWSY